jgi:serine/threonine protein kinase
MYTMTMRRGSPFVEADEHRRPSVDLETARTLVRVLAEGTAPEPSRDGAAAPPGYTLERMLGEGAGGVVWLARRAGSDRPVALKILKRPLGEGKSARWAWRELEIIEQVRAPGTPRLVDYGTIDDRLYIATEHVDGAPIDIYCDRNSPDTRHRVQLLVRLCEATARLHDAGVIHRDLKPSNVLVTGAGAPVIIDLGIASLLASDVMETLTADGAPIGTPAFMSPEQARGERAAIGIRSDIWSLGAIGYLLLTGRTPHDLDNATLYEAVRRVGAEPPQEPRSIEPALPKALGAVLGKACAQDPKARYGSAGELAADLQRWLDHGPVLAQPAGRWQRTVRWAGRHPIITTSTLCGVVVLSTIVSVVVIAEKMLREPTDVRVVGGDTIWLESRANVPLVKLYQAPEPVNGLLAQRIDRHERLGGGWFAVVSHPPPDLSLATDVYVYDPANPKRSPRVIRPPGRSPPLRDPSYDDPVSRDLHTYQVRASEVRPADVFPDRSGSELVVLRWGNPDFPSCLQVFGFEIDGSLAELYRAWIPGHMRWVWLDEERLFVLAGSHNRIGGFERHPQAVIAVRPVLGEVHDRWLTHDTPGSRTNVVGSWVLAQPFTHDPVYRASTNRPIEVTLIPRRSRASGAAGVFEVGLAAANERVAGWWIVDTQMNPIAPMERSDDARGDHDLMKILDRCRMVRSPPWDPNAL